MFTSTVISSVNSMGKSSSKKCAPVSAFDARRNSNFYELAPTASISNPSLVTVSTVESNILETSPSKQFTAEYMEAMYTQYKLDNDLTTNLSYTVIRIVAAIFETLSMDEQTVYIANDFFERFYNDDPHYMTLFGSAMAYNDITQFENKNYTLEHHMILHIIFYFRLQKFIMTTLDDGKEDRAYEILNLVALSHLIMKVDTSTFEQQSKKLIQVIIHFNLITEDQLPAFVYYQVTITSYICSMMQKYKERHLKLYEMMSEQISPARDNYRELKKWKTIVLTLKKSLSKPISLIDKQTDEDKKRTHAGDGDEEREKWYIIRLLKRGYKFRHKTQKGGLKIVHSNLE